MINTFCVAYKLKTHIFEAGTKKNDNNIGRFPGGGLENQNPARTIAHSPPGVKETLNYMLREKTIFATFSDAAKIFSKKMVFSLNI